MCGAQRSPVRSAFSAARALDASAGITPDYGRHYVLHRRLESSIDPSDQRMCRNRGANMFICETASTRNRPYPATMFPIIRRRQRRYRRQQRRAIHQNTGYSNTRQGTVLQAGVDSPLPSAASRLRCASQSASQSERSTGINRPAPRGDQRLHILQIRPKKTSGL
jgi:hypothetical protein